MRREPVVRSSSFWGDVANILCFAPVYRPTREQRFLDLYGTCPTCGRGQDQWITKGSGRHGEVQYRVQERRQRKEGESDPQPLLRRAPE